MQTRRKVEKNKSKEIIKGELPISSRNSEEDVRKTVTTPRSYLHKTTAADIYGKKKPNVLQTPKKAPASSSHNTAKNVSPMKDYLKLTSSSVSVRSSKMAVEKKTEAKANLPTARKSTQRIVKTQAHANVTVSSPVLKRKSNSDLKKDKSNLNIDHKASTASGNAESGRSNMAELFLRQRSKTRTLDENEVKVLKPEIVDNNEEMKNLSRRLSAKPKVFYVDLNGEDKKTEKEKSSEEEMSYEDDFESYESDFDSYHSESQSDRNITTGDERESYEETEEEFESNDAVTTLEVTDIKDLNEEKMLDSGSYDLRDPQRSAQKVKPVRLDFILEGSEDVDKKPSLSDEGFQEMSSSSGVSSMKTVHVDVLDRPLFIDFTISKRNRRKRRIFQHLQQRAKDILSMVTLHEITYMLFEMHPIPYDLYMATFGRNNCTQIAVQTFDDGITEEVQTEEISYCTKWSQFPVQFSKENVHINEKNINLKSGDDFISRFSMLINQKVVKHEEKCDDQSYKDNPLRIFLEQKDGVGPDEMLPQDAYRSKLKICDYSVIRLRKFLKRVESRISNILNLNAGNPDICNLIKRSKFPFSKGHATISTKSITNKTSLIKELKISNVIFSKSKTNLILTVHDKGPSNAFQRSVLCMWDVSGAMQEPLKHLIATDNVTVGRFRGSSDGIVVASLQDGTIHLWDLSEKETWTYDDTSGENPTTLVDVDSDRLTQTELDREWNLRNSHKNYKKEELCLMQSSGYSSSGINIINGDVPDCIVGLEFMGDSNTSAGQDGGRRIIAQISSLQRSGILIMWSIVQEKNKGHESDIGRAFSSKLALEKVQTIYLSEYIDVNLKDTVENFGSTFNLIAAKKRISNRRQEKHLLKPNSSRAKSAIELSDTRPRSAASGVKGKMLQVQNNTHSIWETGIVCNDLKIMRTNNTDNFLIAKNCGEVLCCTRYTGTFKVNRFCVASDTSSITCIEISQNGLPHFLAATESGTVNLCSVLDLRVLLTLDCRNGSSNASEKYKSDHKGRYVGNVQSLDSLNSIQISVGKEDKKMSIKSLVWSRNNPFDMIALLEDGTVCYWRLTSSDINGRRLEVTVAVCVASADLMALVTPHNDVQVHKLCNDRQEEDNLELFQRYLALL